MTKKRSALPVSQNPTLVFCGGAVLIILLCFIAGIAFAETALKNSFGDEDMKLIAQTNLTYTTCLQKNALEQLESSPDVRLIAGNAVDSCSSVLDELRATLEENGVNPDFYHGAVERMKNRAIRRLLPLLMMEKSNRAS